MASSQNELRVVLIGRTGNGKSSIGNSLLHSRSAFYAIQSAQSITHDCQAAKRPNIESNGQQKTLTVVDTPGFFDTDTTMTNKAVESKIASQIFNMTCPGVHAFLIVLCIGRFSPEEQNTVKFIQTIFGQDAVKYCIVVFTREDQLDEGQTLQAFINASPSALRELVRTCGNRTFAINNKLNGDMLERKTKALIQMIDNMVQANNGTFYTNEQYQRIEKQRYEEQRRKEEEEKRKKKDYDDGLINRAREEERKKSEQRERELKSELESARRSQNRSNGGNDMVSMLRALQGFGLGNSTSGMNPGMSMPCPPMSMPHSPMNSYMEMPMQRTGSANFSRGGAHGGRFTGEFMATTGAANGRPIYEGARGGQYYMTESGNKSYRRK